MPDIVDDGESARLEHASDLPYRIGAAGRLAHLVNRGTSHHTVERGRGKGEPAHITRLDLHLVVHSLRVRICERGVRAVAGEIFRAPEIDAHRCARAEPL